MNKIYLILAATLLILTGEALATTRYAPVYKDSVLAITQIEAIGDGLANPGDHTFTGTVDLSGSVSTNYKADSVLDVDVNWGTASTQVSGADVPIIDAGTFYSTDIVEDALQEMGARVQRTATITIAASDATAASIAAAEFGLKLTGIDRFALPGFKPATDFYSKTRFNATSADFDSDVEQTLVTPASEGSGSSYEVAQAENLNTKNEGLGRVNSAYPPTDVRTESDLATPGTYDTITLNCIKNEMTSVSTGQTPVSKFTVVIRMKVALEGDDVDTALGVAV